MLSEIAQALQQYGPWGISAIFAIATWALYRDLVATQKDRIEDLKSVFTDYHEDAQATAKAWQDASSMLEAIREELGRRRR